MFWCWVMFVRAAHKSKEDHKCIMDDSLVESYKISSMISDLYTFCLENSHWHKRQMITSLLCSCMNEVKQQQLCIMNTTKIKYGQRFWTLIYYLFVFVQDFELLEIHLSAVTKSNSQSFFIWSKWQQLVVTQSYRIT